MQTNRQDAIHYPKLFFIDQIVRATKSGQSTNIVTPRRASANVLNWVTSSSLDAPVICVPKDGSTFHSAGGVYVMTGVMIVIRSVACAWRVEITQEGITAKGTNFV